MMNKKKHADLRGRRKADANINEKTIILHINDERELYGKFSCPAGNAAGLIDAEINPEIIDYLEKEAEDIPVFFNMKINLDITGMSSEKYGRAEDMIKTAVLYRIQKANIKLSKNRWGSIMMILAGFIPLTLQQILSSLVTRYALREFLLVVSWVFLWKAVEQIFFERKKIIMEKHALRKILNSMFIY